MRVTTVTARNRDGQTIIELIMFLALFSVGFIAGHFVALEAGIVSGIVAGFLTCYAVAVATSLIFRVAQKRFSRDSKPIGGVVPVKTEPDSAANGSQPIRSQTNGTSGTAGSRR